MSCIKLLNALPSAGRSIACKLPYTLHIPDLPNIRNQIIQINPTLELIVLVVPVEPPLYCRYISMPLGKTGLNG